VLELFSTGSESYRRAPVYDFSRPPHEGLLNYETLPWGITSVMWLESAARARGGFTGF
jgi:N-acetylglucosamine malate deacetylase 2